MVFGPWKFATCSHNDVEAVNLKACMTASARLITTLWHLPGGYFCEIENDMEFIFRMVALVVIFGGFIFFMKSKEEKREAEIQAIFAPYNAEMTRYLDKKTYSSSKFPAKGYILFVDEPTKKVTRFSDNQPKNPSEVYYSSS